MLEEALRRQSLLLVLDNFEHVVDAADLVGEMVRWSADLRVLVTSRARLRVAGEQVFEVQPLSVDPEPGAPASPTRWRSSSRWRRRSTRGSSWTQHVEDVDGDLPVRGRAPPRDRDRRRPPPHPAAAAAAAAPAGRLGSAAAAGRDLPDRQQTIPATIDWSLQLLGPAGAAAVRPARRLQRRGAARRRRGGLGRTATCVDPLSVLVDHSLVRRTTGNRARAPLRDAGAGAGARRRGSSTTRRGDGRGRARGVRRGVRRGPLRASLDRRGRSLARRHHRDARGGARRARLGAGATADLPLTARITAALGAYWHLEGHHAEGRRWVDEMLAGEDELDPAVSARIRLAAGFLAFPGASPTRARHWQRATDLFRELGETRLLAYALAVEVRDVPR